MIPHERELKAEGIFLWDIVVKMGGGRDPLSKQAERKSAVNIVVKGGGGFDPY